LAPVGVHKEIDEVPGPIHPAGRGVNAGPWQRAEGSAEPSESPEAPEVDPGPDADVQPSEQTVDPPPAVEEPTRQRGRRAWMIVLAVWALVMAGEIGYVIGRDRTSNTAAAQTAVAPGDISVLQVIIQSQQDRIDSLLANAASTTTTKPAAVEIPLETIDPLGGEAVIVYSGTLARTACDGYADASACSAENDLDFRLARIDAGTLTLSTALFENAPVAREGTDLHAQGSVTNPTSALACDGQPTATSFDVRLTPDRLSVSGEKAVVGSYSARLTLTAPVGGACPRQLQSIYAGAITSG
jgi:hypothetical protein